MSQADLARKIGSRQSAVARLEDPTYGRQSLAVLHKVAKVFDVATWVEFVPFSTYLRRTSDLSPRALTPKSYREEFGESGEPLPSLALRADGSAISSMHYIAPVHGPTYLPMNGSIK